MQPFTHPDTNATDEYRNWGGVSMVLIWQAQQLQFCCRILHCVKENLCRALVQQSIGLIFPISWVIYNPYNIRTFYIQMISSLFCYEITILFISYYNENTCLNYVNPRLILLIQEFTKSQAISCQLDFNSLHLHAYIICCTNDASHNVTGCSNPNVHAQFPWAIPYLIVSDYYWFSISGTFLLQVCLYCARFNYTPKS